MNLTARDTKKIVTVFKRNQIESKSCDLYQMPTEKFESNSTSLFTPVVSLKYTLLLSQIINPTIIPSSYFPISKDTTTYSHFTPTKFKN